MTREQIEAMRVLLDAEAGAGFTQKALGRLPVLNMIADALRELIAKENAEKEAEKADG